MELYIIRHGQSTNNALGEDITNRVMDAPLTDLGHQQAQLVGQRRRLLAYLMRRDNPRYRAVISRLGLRR